MNYKFLVPRDARMCSEHLGIDNYWSFGKNISQEVAVEDHKMVSDLMYNYYQESKTKKQLVFDIDNINSIDGAIFKE